VQSRGGSSAHDNENGIQIPVARQRI